MWRVIYTQGQSRLSVNYETCENSLKFSQVVADGAFHTCAALEREGIATLAVLVTFAIKSNTDGTVKTVPLL